MEATNLAKIVEKLTLLTVRIQIRVRKLLVKVSTAKCKNVCSSQAIVVKRDGVANQYSAIVPASESTSWFSIVQKNSVVDW